MYNLIGFVGVALLLSSYFLLQFGKLKLEGFWYSCMNLLASLALTISLINDWNFPGFVLQLIWILISGYGMWKFFNKNSEDLMNHKK